MSLWTHLSAIAHRLFLLGPTPESEISTSVDMIDVSCGPEPDDVDFTAAVVGLGAKMAKADGFVTDEEVEAFSRTFRTAPQDFASVRRVFNIARQTVHGYESYARMLAKKYADRPCLLEGVLDGLFQIALADGFVTLDELEYLRTVSDIFGFSEDDYKRIKASHMGADPDDPYEILGVDRSAEYDDIRRAYRKLMKDHHPDRLAATRDAPREFEVVAHEKAAAITSAYAQIRAQRGFVAQPD